MVSFCFFLLVRCSLPSLLNLNSKLKFPNHVIFSLEYWNINFCCCWVENLIFLWFLSLQKMFKNTFQSGFLSILYSLGYDVVGLFVSYFSFICLLLLRCWNFALFSICYFCRSKPLQIWDKEGNSFFVFSGMRC